MFGNSIIRLRQSMIHVFASHASHVIRSRYARWASAVSESTLFADEASDASGAREASNASRLR